MACARSAGSRSSTSASPRPESTRGRSPAPWWAEIARLCAPGATITSVLSITERDRQVGAVLPDDPGRLRHGFARYGLDLVDAREATPAEIAATRSTWAKRLGAGSRGRAC